MIRYSIHILIAVISLVYTLIFFETSNFDFVIQNFLYDFASKQWLWNDNEAISHFIFYSGIKKLIIIFELLLIGAWVFHKHLNISNFYLSGIRIIVISLAIVPLTTGTIKAISNTACPKDLSYYNGDIHYIPVFKRYKDEFRPAKKQRCFPAAHASAGFALLALFFLFKLKRNRNIALVSALTIAWSMGIYKMMIGDHFMSHTLVSMELAWLLICVIAYIEHQYFSKGLEDIVQPNK